MVKKYAMERIRTYSMVKWMIKSRIYSVIQQVVIIDPEMHHVAKTSCRLHGCTFFSVSKKADFLSSDMTYEKKAKRDPGIIKPMDLPILVGDDLLQFLDDLRRRGLGWNTMKGLRRARQAPRS